jgi:hypothetical protein
MWENVDQTLLGGEWDESYISITLSDNLPVFSLMLIYTSSVVFERIFNQVERMMEDFIQQSPLDSDDYIMFYKNFSRFCGHHP